MFYTIYKTTNVLDGKYYIGKHQTLKIDDRYLGSGIWLKRAIKLHGRRNFKKEILFVFETEAEMNAKEKELITEELVKSPLSYNIGIGGEGGPHFKGRKHSKDFSAKMIATKVKNGTNKMSEDQKRKISLFMKEKHRLSPQKPSAESRKKTSESLKRFHANKNKIAERTTGKSQRSSRSRKSVQF